ncbi:uncharacterized protein L969DRAFT_94770 [Mixia osmundae IAM 14324]|uniref:RRM domain-containing protein n=1 Tax=Mixia osmundae (strain CBS 9802 / IAM 14324 / JCM 22182 / KY 12970) TaxID=764103 RepID=G7E469_MIXOS|nr:uncharacterized protein L969DRAFT_94770 [Mixia osmundae IAM 14324]KEI39725.1 hypothetical protein L969DRAFT_94770 [Mixia osmundae IAM 14324]GAA97629.1 hypothetical protein E5Q_04307 [Mixia osmundae IAM 14324]
MASVGGQKRYFDDAVASEESESRKRTKSVPDDSDPAEPGTTQKAAKVKRTRAPPADESETTTVHVSGLEERISSEQLTQYFSSVGPVRSAFVITDKVETPPDAVIGVTGSNAQAVLTKARSRGFGYVKFVERSDAERAVQTLSGTSLSDSSKKIKVTLAKPRLRADEDGQLTKPGKAAPAWVARKEAIHARAQTLIKPEAVDAPSEDGKDHKSEIANRSVLVQGLSPTAPVPKPSTSEIPRKINWAKALHKHIKKSLGSSAEGQQKAALFDVAYPVQLYGVTSETSAAKITVSTPKQARKLALDLHGKILQASYLTAVTQWEYDATTRQGKAAGGGRLMFRNLDFGISELDLRTCVSQYGPIHSIDIPQTTAPSYGQAAAQSRGRGFAFVWFIRREDAQKALEGANGRKVWPGYGQEHITSAGQVEEADRGRVMAVDWALGKRDWEAAEAGRLQADPKTHEEQEQDEEMAEDRSNEPDEASETDDADEGESESESESEEEIEDLMDSDEKEDDEGPKQRSSSTDAATLFVRNIQFEATEDELYQVFKQFGPVRYARIVMDKKLNRSKGTGFVCFYNEAHARETLAESDLIHATSQPATEAKPAQNPFSVLTPDPSTISAKKLSLHGRVLGVSSAVSREQADKLREDRDKKSGKGDKRNFYLMREGVVVPGTPQAKLLTAADLEARQDSYDARKALLRSNPSLFVSRQRLSIRQLPLHTTEGLLKRLAGWALRQWRIEVKQGKRKELLPEEREDEIKDLRPKVKPGDTEKPSKPASRVQQAKILRQADRVDPLTNVGRSKGYGFLQMTSHADALRVLRWTNANPEAVLLLRSWWKEDLENRVKRTELETESEDKDVRLKRLREKIVELEEEASRAASKKKGKADSESGSGRATRTLMIELSIENAITTKRRQEKADRSRTRAKKSKTAPETSAAIATEATDGRKRKHDEESPSKSEKPNALGSIIGRKRREKRARKS